MIRQQNPQDSTLFQISRLALDRYFSPDFYQPAEVFQQKSEGTKMDRSPAMQFYFRQFAADENVMVMDLDAIGAHILLMCMAGASQELWQVPSDEQKIRRALRNPSNEDWERIKEQLLDGPWKISYDGKWWVQHGMMRSFLKQKAIRKIKSEAGKLGAAKRWDGTDNGTGYGTDDGRVYGTDDGKRWPASASASAIKPNPPLPPLAGGAKTNSFQFECQENLIVTVLVPLGRRLWRTQKDRENFESRCNQQARGYVANLVEVYFKLRGFSVEVTKVAAHE